MKPSEYQQRRQDGTGEACYGYQPSSHQFGGTEPIPHPYQTGLPRPQHVSENAWNERPSQAPPELIQCEIGEHQVPQEYFLDLMCGHKLCLMCLRKKTLCPVCKRDFDDRQKKNIQDMVRLIIDDPEECPK